MRSVEENQWGENWLGRASQPPCWAFGPSWLLSFMNEPANHFRTAGQEKTHVVCSVSHTNTHHSPCKQDTHAYWHVCAHTHILTVIRTHNSIALSHSCTSVTYLFSVAAFISFPLFIVCLCLFLCICMCVYVWVSVCLFWQPDTKPFQRTDL